MRPVRIVMVFGVLSAALVGDPSLRRVVSDSAQRAVVGNVVDGDTLTLRDGRKIRFVQIDTPELGGGECYSRAARTALLHLAPLGSAVTLEDDPALDKADRYGRLLRYIRRNGVNVNLELSTTRRRGTLVLRGRPWPLRRRPPHRRDVREGSETGTLGVVPTHCARPHTCHRYRPQRAGDVIPAHNHHPRHCHRGPGHRM